MPGTLSIEHEEEHPVQNDSTTKAKIQDTVTDTQDTQPDALIPPASEGKKPGVGTKVLQLLSNIVFVVVLFTMVLLVFAMVQSRMTGTPPRVAGYEMYIVIGGSMSPTFEAGSLAFVRPVDPQTVGVGDVITYRDQAGGSGLTTHRVMEVHREDGALSFITRGDANRVNDAVPVDAGSIVGSVQFTIPYAGYLMNFAQTPKGLLAMIIAPGLLVIIFELRNLVRYAAEWEEQKKARKAAEAGASPDA